MKNKPVRTMDALFGNISAAEEQYVNGLITKGECVLKIENWIAEVKMHDLENASEIAAEYKMKLVPEHWKMASDE